ncbi:hypothetical protein VST7929_01089 [Vibrio stylophorae]|uniref:Mannosyl-glycoprotein endo-beta-N-acetylglucosamidase-like domain-containing protein n=1 Tax=Vibrio stylophorae TaxID=659351 RepID=A0ABN8DR57_9VIBR|nr:glucosaminidase domain-containing protein [Vibrio stylophorae]CAH0533225.1 hypothetical protein VST7929_01089 [Vibrio stylophorae]
MPKNHFRHFLRHFSCHSKMVRLLNLTLLLTFAVCAMPSRADTLPLPPEKINHPYPDVAITELHSAQSLVSYFDKRNYQLNTVYQTRVLPAIFVENLPSNLQALSVPEKTSTYIRLLLPTVVAVNAQILRVRHALLDISQKPKASWSDAEVAWVNALMTHYGVKNNDLNELLLRVDIIPVGMALAQGIDESGWGTSHFAIAGSNLYGEHLPSTGGKYLTTPGGNVKVAAFDNLYAGTASYMHNLNSTQAYREMWQLRQQLRAQKRLTGDALVGALIDYSTRGQAYVDNLRALIHHHQLDHFDRVALTRTNPQVVRFAR